MTTQTSAVPTVSARTTRRLLTAGALAGPIFTVLGAGQVLFRDGFDISRHALSLAVNGSAGWVQIANFLVSGLLVMSAGAGLGRALDSRWTARLLVIHGIGMVSAGIFLADPARGFPPGTPEDATSISWHGLLHFAAGGMGFAGFVAACFVVARAVSRRGWRTWPVFSRVTGVLFLVAFLGIASGSAGPTTLAFTGAILLSFGWLTLLCRRAAVEIPAEAPSLKHG